MNDYFNLYRGKSPVSSDQKCQIQFHRGPWDRANHVHQVRTKSPQ